MTQEWSDYIGLLEQAAGLPEQEARGIAQADSVYAAEARRLQNSLALAERELGNLKDRNHRLQVGVRDLTRSLGISIPAGSPAELLASAQLSDAIKSAEYDLDQIRRSVEHLDNHRRAASRPVAPAAPSTLPMPTPAPESGPNKRTVSSSTALVAGLVVVVVLAILAVILL